MGPGLYGSGTLPLVGTASFAVFRSEKGAPKEPSWQKFTCTIPSGTAASLFSLLHPVANNPAAASSNAARRSGAVAAINGSYFDIKQGTSICYLRKDGVVVDTTAIGVLSTVSNGAVKIDKGKLDIIAWKKQDEKTCEQKEGSILVSGPLMLLDGKACDLSACNQSFVQTKHPRSAVALMKDGTVFLIAVAGRFEGKAEGINIPELTHLLRVLGAKKALNLDGGGSTTLWSASAPDNGIVNKLTDNKLYDNKGERKVANSLCVYE